MTADDRRLVSDNLAPVTSTDDAPMVVATLTPEEHRMLVAYRDMRCQMPDTDSAAMLMQIIPVSRHLIETPEARAAVELAARQGASRAMVAWVVAQAVGTPDPEATT